MTLLEELQSTRDYWLVPSSPTGLSDSDELKILKVQKGTNNQEIEEYCAHMERQMIAALSKSR